MAVRAMALRRSSALRVGPRSLSSYAFDDATSVPGAGREVWPRQKANTVVNMVPQGEVHIVERMNKFLAAQEAGWFLAAPGADRIAFVVDTREQSMDVEAGNLATSDGVGVHASGSLRLAFVDAEKAAYGSADPYAAVRTLVGRILQKEVAAVAVEDVNDSVARGAVEAKVFEALSVDPSLGNWGVEARGFTLGDLCPQSRLLSEATEHAAATEAAMRAAVAQAESESAAAAKRADAQRLLAMEHAAYADEISDREAEHLAKRLSVLADAEANATAVRAKATADAIRTVAAALKTDADREAANIVLQQQLAALAAGPLHDVAPKPVQDPDDQDADLKDDGDDQRAPPPVPTASLFPPTTNLN